MKIIAKYDIEVYKEECRRLGMDFWNCSPEDLIKVWEQTTRNWTYTKKRPDDGGELMKPWVRRHSSPVPFAEVEFEQQEEEADEE